MRLPARAAAFWLSRSRVSASGPSIRQAYPDVRGEVTDTWSGAGRSQTLVGVEGDGGGTHTSIGLISEGHTAAL